MSPEERRSVLSRFGVANEEVRVAQSELFEDVMKQTITIDTLKTHSHLLDTDIKIVFNYKQCSKTRELESNRPFYVRNVCGYDTNEYLCSHIDMIKTGFCECRSCKVAKSFGIGVVGFRLIHTLVANDKNLPLIVYLHESGCDMNLLTLSGEYSPLPLAVKSGSEEIVKYYVQQFDSIEFGPTLQKALSESISNATISKTLLSAKNVNVNFCEENDGSYLCHLLRELRYKCDDEIDHIKAFLKAGADLAIADKRGNNPLMIAAMYGCVETVRLLLQHGADVDATNDGGDTALHLAALPEPDNDGGDNLHCLDENLAKISELLLGKGADPDIPNRYDITPLSFAVAADCFEVVQTLLAANVNMDIDNCGKDGGCSRYYCFRGSYLPNEGVPQSLLHVAFEQSDTDIFLLFRKAGYDITKETGIMEKYSTYCEDYRYEYNFYKALFNDWVRSSKSPGKLESLCAAKVRKSLGHKIHSKIEELDLAIPLKNNLLLKDVLPSQRRLARRVDREDEDSNQSGSETSAEDEDSNQSGSEISADCEEDDTLK